MATGTPETREYYDHEGWQLCPDGARLRELNRFGMKEDGPIRQKLYGQHLRRIEAAVRSAGNSLNLLECGCGGNPMIRLLRTGDRYTGVDFSTTGLGEADSRLRAWGGTCRLQEADICRLPFSDGEFDAIYSAHVLYHIDSAPGQAAALEEMSRVLRPGGVAVLALANPHPLLFPIRFGKNLAAETPMLRSVVVRFRQNNSLPYRPMNIGGYKRKLQRHGSVDIVTGGIPSVWFYRNVTEYRYPGKILWHAIRSLESRAPRLSASLGNYFLLIFRKT